MSVDNRDAPADVEPTPLPEADDRPGSTGFDMIEQALDSQPHGVVFTGGGVRRSGIVASFQPNRKNRDG